MDHGKGARKGFLKRSEMREMVLKEYVSKREVMKMQAVRVFVCGMDGCVLSTSWR